jgi:ribosomal protein S18 acetylase RimI-like enzyme
LITSIQALHLEVEHDNHAAQALYRRLGFTDHNRYLMTKCVESTALGDPN